MDVKLVPCAGHDGLGGCDHLAEVPADWVTGTAYCSIGCYVSDECSEPEKCIEHGRAAAPNGS